MQTTMPDVARARWLSSIAAWLGLVLLATNLLVAAVGAVLGVEGAPVVSNALAAIVYMWAYPLGTPPDGDPVRILLYVAGWVHWLGVPACVLLAVLGRWRESRSRRRAQLGLVLGLVCGLPAIWVVFLLARG